MLFKYDKESNNLIKLEETSSSSEGLSEVQNIEFWIKQEPSILFGNDETKAIKIIGEQTTSVTGKRSDLVGVDRDGNIVIIELKRNIAQKMTEFQAITYASYFALKTFDEICKLYADYLSKNKDVFGLSEDTDFLEKAKGDLKEFCTNINIDENPEEFNKNQRIILVAGDFSSDLLSAVTWLILKGIQIECIKLVIYKYNNDLFITSRKILPTPGISEYFVRLKINEEKENRTKRVQEEIRKDQKLYLDIEAHYERLSEPLNEYLKNFVNDLINLGAELTNLSNMGFHLIKGNKKIMVTTSNKSKIEFRFSKAKKEDIEKLLIELNINRLRVKDKADIEPYNTPNPTPSIDIRKNDDVELFENIKKVCKKWLEL